MWLHTTLEGPGPLHDFGGVLGQHPLDTFFWALTIPRSRLLVTSVCVHLRSQVAPYRPHISLVTLHRRTNKYRYHPHPQNTSIHPPIHRLVGRTLTLYSRRPPKGFHKGVGSAENQRPHQWRLGLATHDKLGM